MLLLKLKLRKKQLRKLKKPLQKKKLRHQNLQMMRHCLSDVCSFFIFLQQFLLNFLLILVKFCLLQVIPKSICPKISSYLIKFFCKLKYGQKKLLQEVLTSCIQSFQDLQWHLSSYKSKCLLFLQQVLKQKQYISQ